MTLSLHTIQKSKGTLKKRKRLGRGNSSGDGNYSGKGMKGQNSRSGVSGLKRLGMKKNLLQIPKSRGFKSLQPKNQVVSVDNINKNFQDGEIVTAAALVVKGLVAKATLPVKILGKEKLLVKVTFDRKIKMSESLTTQTTDQAKENRQQKTVKTDKK